MLGRKHVTGSIINVNKDINNIGQYIFILKLKKEHIDTGTFYIFEKEPVTRINSVKVCQ